MNDSTQLASTGAYNIVKKIPINAPFGSVIYDNEIINVPKGSRCVWDPRDARDPRGPRSEDPMPLAEAPGQGFAQTFFSPGVFS